MGFVDKGDRMVNRYRIVLRTWKCTKKPFSHCPDMTILTALFTVKSQASKMTQNFSGRFSFINTFFCITKM
jgi:hypothetical protein